MRIGIEARSLGSASGGIQVYTRHLIKNMVSLFAEPDYFFYLAHGVSEDIFGKGQKRIIPTYHGSLQVVWDRLLLPNTAKQDGLDILHLTKGGGHKVRSAKKIISCIHDLIPVLFPESQTLAQYYYWRMQFEAARKFADHIITTSQSNKNDIMRLLNIPEEKISITHLAASDSFKPREREGVRNTFPDLPEKFIVFVGNIQKRKNLGVVFRAMEKLGDVHFVIVGKKAWKYEEDWVLIDRLGLRKRIHHLEDVDFEQLPKLYNLATALVFPSYYEGFGLPPLEAMQSGLPVIAANTGSIPEIVGEAGTLLDPDDVDAWAGAIQRVLEDDTLKMEMKEKGIIRAKDFSWESTAKQTMQVYQETLRR